MELEKAYDGLLWVVPEKDFGATVSYGEQTWQLNKGFLFSQYAGGFNAADWGASYLAARTALENSALAKVRLGKLSLEGFLVDPQEYYENDSGTRYRGADLQYADGKRLELGAVWYDVPQSKSTFVLPDGARVPREGLRTVNLRAATATLGGLTGLAFESEWAHQSSSAFRMSADAWYASLGYEAASVRWSPSLTYRYAFFEGDDPDTPAYERFDAPQSSGSDTWLQGNVFKKTVVNSNLESHRVRFAVKPSAGVSVILNYFYLWADELNNRGGARPLQQLPSRTLGQEVDLNVNWSVSRNLFFLGFAGIAFPGPALEKSLPDGASPWATVQLSLLWNLLGRPSAPSPRGVDRDDAKSPRHGSIPGVTRSAPAGAAAGGGQPEEGALTLSVRTLRKRRALAERHPSGRSAPRAPIRPFRRTRTSTPS